MMKNGGAPGSGPTGLGHLGVYGRDGTAAGTPPSGPGGGAQTGQGTPHPVRPTKAPVLMHPANAALLQYWHMVRGDNAVAAWADFDLMEITAYLPSLTLLEWTPDDQLVYRFAGLQLVSWMGRDPTNDSLKAYGGVAQCKAMVPSLSARTLALLKVAYETAAGQRVYMEDLCLPLSAPGRPVGYVLIGSQLLEGTLIADGERDTIRPESFRLLGRVRLPLDRIDRGAPLIYALNQGRSPQTS